LDRCPRRHFHIGDLKTGEGVMTANLSAVDTDLDELARHIRAAQQTIAKSVSNTCH
jgi:hypothetical protein